MSKFIINNIILSKKISYLIIYIMIFIFSLVLIYNDSKNNIEITKFVLENINFIPFLLIPSMLLLTMYVYGVIKGDLLLMQRFDTKKNLIYFIIKNLFISILIIDIVIFLFIFIFIFILKTHIIHFDSLIVLILNLIFNTTLISFFILLLTIYLNKYIVIFINLLICAIIYGFNMRLYTTVNNLSLYAFIIKFVIIVIQLILIINIPKKNMFSEVYKWLV